jgi:hypothetical protein
MGSIRDKQAPLTSEYYARNVKTRGKARSQVNRLMREQRITRGEAVDILNAERMRCMAQWEAREFDDLAERFEERQHRRTIRAITEDGDRALRIANFLSGE